ncbi:TPA: deoxyguanosinetriphosphate triphosphohydrolase [bacterium]|nr:deoxyguanosinetriphosphate triphosphohydrolase [bacterium]
MLIRELVEEYEAKTLSPYSMLSVKSKGRKKDEEPCPIRTIFQRDRDRIIHSRAFRELKYKTQVFLLPQIESIRTRLTHTIEVSQIARTIARALRLNEDLTEAIALGHDLGHPPFGHTGESALNEVSTIEFDHSEQSLRIVDVLEKDGLGLNLTYETRDGILNHSLGEDCLLSCDYSKGPNTLEGMVVLFSDKIAYINHDIQDAEEAGLITIDMFPSYEIRLLGRRSSERINKLVNAVVGESLNKDYIGMDKEFLEAVSNIRSYLYENVYLHPKIRQEAEKAKRVIMELYSYYLKNPDKIKKKFFFLENKSVERPVCDYIAGLSDMEALSEYSQIFLPKPWKEGE